MLIKNTIKNIEYGLMREAHNKSIIENVFNLKLFHSLNQYANFDWVDKNEFMVVEHKSFNLTFNIHNHTLLKTNKVLNSNSIFIFEYNTTENTKQLFYLRYSSAVFKTLRQEWVKYNLKIMRELFFIIPNELLISFKSTDFIPLQGLKKNIQFINELLEDDLNKSIKKLNNLKYIL